MLLNPVIALRQLPVDLAARSYPLLNESRLDLTAGEIQELLRLVKLLFLHLAARRRVHASDRLKSLPLATRLIVYRPQLGHLRWAVILHGGVSFVVVWH